MVELVVGFCGGPSLGRVPSCGPRASGKWAGRGRGMSRVQDGIEGERGNWNGSYGTYAGTEGFKIGE